MPQKKNFEIWIFKFTNKNMMYGKHHAIIINHPTNSKFKYIIPMTTKMSDYNVNHNDFFVTLGKERYANISHTEMVHTNDHRFISKAINDELSFDEKMDIRFTFEDMILKQIRKIDNSIFKTHPEDTIVHQFTEDVYNNLHIIGQRQIDAVFLYSKVMDNVPGNPSLNYYKVLQKKGVNTDAVDTSFYRASNTINITAEVSYKKYQENHQKQSIQKGIQM